MRTLPRTFYDRPTLDVAADLIGKVVVHVTPAGRTSGRIVEVEAYIGESDPACHAASGLTERNAPLYGRPGRAYVYLNYGMHYLLNAVTECEGVPGAVLIRALEPLSGLELMHGRRTLGVPVRPHALCRGPGNVSRALGISMAQNRLDLCGSRLFVADDAASGDDASHVPDIAWGSRIGIRVGTDRQWRGYVIGSPCVSNVKRAEDSLLRARL